VFRPIVELQEAINRYIAEHIDDPAPFVWTKTAAQLNRPNASMSPSLLRIPRPLGRGSFIASMH
jgi:hypothetical protein